jgi:hypothetical protein
MRIKLTELDRKNGRNVTGETKSVARRYESAKALKEATEGILREIGDGYQVHGEVVGDEDRSRWFVNVQTPSGHVSIPVPAELAEDLSASGRRFGLTRLRNLVLFFVGREELIWKREE